AYPGDVRHVKSRGVAGDYRIASCRDPLWNRKHDRPVASRVTVDAALLETVSIILQVPFQELDVSGKMRQQLLAVLVRPLLSASYQNKWDIWQSPGRLEEYLQSLCLDYPGDLDYLRYLSFWFKVSRWRTKGCRVL